MSADRHAVRWMQSSRIASAAVRTVRNVKSIDMKDKIVLFATGGTISSTGGSGNAGLSAKLRGEYLCRDLPDPDSLSYEVETMNFSVVNSTVLRPADMVRMAGQINALLRREDVTGVVVTHGTSLMEETAFVLDMLISSEKPVVLTGAQRSATYPWPDGPSNLNDAFTVAADPASKGKGVIAVFGGGIFEGFRLKKIHTTALRAFSAGEAGPLGSVYYGQVDYFRERVRKHIPYADIKDCSVAIIPFYSGADNRYIKAAVESNEDGIVVEGVGLGNVSEEYYNGIVQAREKGIPVVVTSRCPGGRIIPMYAYKGGGASLMEQGVIFSSYQSSKARLLLMLLLGGGCPDDELKKYFE